MQFLKTLFWVLVTAARPPVLVPQLGAGDDQPVGRHPGRRQNPRPATDLLPPGIPSHLAVDARQGVDSPPPDRCARADPCCDNARAASKSRRRSNDPDFRRARYAGRPPRRGDRARRQRDRRGREAGPRILLRQRRRGRASDRRASDCRSSSTSSCTTSRTPSRRRSRRWLIWIRRSSRFMHRGDAAMMAAAKAAAPPRTKVVAVTVLTSLDRDDLFRMGVDYSPATQVERLTGLARDSGVDGIVCSGAEVARARGDMARGIFRRARRAARRGRHRRSEADRDSGRGRQ